MVACSQNSLGSGFTGIFFALRHFITRTIRVNLQISSNTILHAMPALSSRVRRTTISRASNTEHSALVNFEADSDDDPAVRQKRANVVCLLIYFTMGVGVFISSTSRLRLFESILCRQHYEQDPSLVSEVGDIPEDLCKVAVVQSKLAGLLGWQSLFDNLVGLICTLPFGELADKFGQKRILVLSFLGQTLSWIWVLIVCKWLC